LSPIPAISFQQLLFRPMMKLVQHKRYSPHNIQLRMLRELQTWSIVTALKCKRNSYYERHMNTKPNQQQRKQVFVGTSNRHLCADAWWVLETTQAQQLMSHTTTQHATARIYVSVSFITVVYQTPKAICYYFGTVPHRLVWRYRYTGNWLKLKVGYR